MISNGVRTSSSAMDKNRGAVPEAIVYTCYGGAHSSPVAAAIHLGLLPRTDTPTPAQIASIPLFDASSSADRGRLVLAGSDRDGVPVYVLGRGKEGPEVMQQAVRSGLLLAGTERIAGSAGGGLGNERILFVDTMPCVNPTMRLGGYTSRRLGFIKSGRPIVAFGTTRAYPRLVQLVERVQAYIRHGEHLHRAGVGTTRFYERVLR